MLIVKDINVFIGKHHILRNVSIEVPKGSLTGLIGRNGAGKTTFMKAIMGILPVKNGQIIINKEDITRKEPYYRAYLNIGYMPEDRRLIPELTVEENILLPLFARKIKDYNAKLSYVYELIPEVEGMSSRKALQLSGGQQKLVALARAIINGENLLLLDEPFEGVAPALAKRLLEILNQLKIEGRSIILSESDYTHSSKLVDQSYVIERGEIIQKN